MTQDDFLKKFGFNVKIERMRKNYTQNHLAELMGVDVTYISSIECGTQNVTLKTIEKIAMALEVEAYKLFKFE